MNEINVNASEINVMLSIPSDGQIHVDTRRNPPLRVQDFFFSAPVGDVMVFLLRLRSEVDKTLAELGTIR